MAKLSHPNIPSIYDVHFTEANFLIIFQFIEGQTLREIINESGPVPIATARNWFHQIASALDHAHKSGIIHRDIKPENIILKTDKESAYLVDFGIAITAEDATCFTERELQSGCAGAAKNGIARWIEGRTRSKTRSG